MDPLPRDACGLWRSNCVRGFMYIPKVNLHGKCQFCGTPEGIQEGNNIPQELHLFLMNVMFPSQIRWAHGRRQVNPFHHQFVDALCISTSIVNTWVAARPRMLSLVELNILGFPPRSCRYLVCSSVRSNLNVFWNRDWHDGFSPDQTELTRPSFLQKKKYVENGGAPGLFKALTHSEHICIYQCVDLQNDFTAEKYFTTKNGSVNPKFWDVNG